MSNRPGIAFCFALIALLAGGPIAAEEVEESVYTESDYQAFSPEDCLGCHDDEELEGDTARGQELELYVDEQILADSVHADRLCTDCHRARRISTTHPTTTGSRFA